MFTTPLYVYTAVARAHTQLPHDNRHWTCKRLPPDSIRGSIRIRIVAADSIRNSIRTEISDSQVPRFWWWLGHVLIQEGLRECLPLRDSSNQGRFYGRPGSHAPTQKYAPLRPPNEVHHVDILTQVYAIASLGL